MVAVSDLRWELVTRRRAPHQRRVRSAQRVRTKPGARQPIAHKPTPAEINGGVWWWTAAVVILIASAILGAAWALIG